MTGSTECTRIRISLGVYVLGAIEPAERALVDEHLNDCARCRNELAGLAALPALLGRVTEDQLEQLGSPPAELLDTMLAQAAAESRARRRGSRRWLAAAAAAVVVAGAGVGVTLETGETRPGPAATRQAAPPASTSPAPPLAKAATVSGTDPATGVSMRIKLQPKAWGTAFTVRLTGAPPGARCRLIAIDKSGRRDVAGGWRVEEEGYADFNGSSMFPLQAIASLEVRTVDGKRLLTLPA